MQLSHVAPCTTADDVDVDADVVVVVIALLVVMGEEEGLELS